jgi:hypothetical protein
MTGNAINAKSEALELSSEELDAVSGGAVSENQMKALDFAHEVETMKAFRNILENVGP